MLNTKVFPDHGWRFGNPKAFYITVNYKDYTSVICIPNYYQMFCLNDVYVKQYNP